MPFNISQSTATSAVRSPNYPVGSSGVTAAGNYYAPTTTASGAQVDPGGSANHLPISYFNPGSSAQGLPTGGSGLGAPGVPSSSGCSACDFVTTNFWWIAAAFVVLLLLWVFVLKK